MLNICKKLKFFTYICAIGKVLFWGHPCRFFDDMWLHGGCLTRINHAEDA